ncbi:unnamed protein product [Effrenium voratum]|uniref:Uncharacterized protein n=1 Tax=Effrenium voratum TaxID=2562239 RepID=A0AA36HWA7_9DINO|nr:unnamed protein product [Effrenium voratum]
MAQDAVAAESQQLLDTLREGYTARGAGWLREELAKQTAVQLRQLAGTAGVQQREDGRNMSKAELLEKVAQHISEKQARRGGDAALLSWAAFAAETSCCDPVATESQQLLDSMSWPSRPPRSCDSLLAPGVQQREAGRNMSKAELLEKVAQHISEKQDPVATESQQLLDSMREGLAARGAGWLREELAKQTDPAATESQLLDSMREGFTARGAGWLREELAKQTAVQLRQLAGTAGVQQREAGRNMSKAELLEKVAQHISEKQDPVATESQQLLDSMSWPSRPPRSCDSLLAPGVQQREAGRNMSKAELLEKVAQHISEKQDPVAIESQQLLDTLREGYAARGAGWLRQELTKRTAVQLRQLAGAAGVQQYEAGRNLPKAELLEKVAQHISEKQAR